MLVRDDGHAKIFLKISTRANPELIFHLREPVRRGVGGEKKNLTWRSWFFAQLPLHFCLGV